MKIFRDVTPDLIRGPDGSCQNGRCVVRLLPFGTMFSPWIPGQARNDNAEIRVICD